MKLLKKVSVLTCTLLVWGVVAQAQVSTNPNKFLGNITTWSNVDAGGGIPQFYTLWNQITCENESKWSSVEGNNGNFNWSGADRAFNYAIQHGFTYKFHALVWGAQYPSWLESLSANERFAALTNWFDHAKEHYETLPMIDVVNEAVGMHQQGNPMMNETLGGGGKTGYDWLIKAFDMAHERWPNSILIYNDYNSIQYDIDNYLDLVRTLRDAGAPIDAYGNQSHAVTGMSATNLSNALERNFSNSKAFWSFLFSASSSFTRSSGLFLAIGSEGLVSSCKDTNSFSFTYLSIQLKRVCRDLIPYFSIIWAADICPCMYSDTMAILSVG